MSFGRKLKAALAPICLIFSLFTCSQAVSADRCVDLFKIDLVSRYGHLVDHYRQRTKDLSEDEVIREGLNEEIFALVRLRMDESQTQYVSVINQNDQLAAVQIWPTLEGSWLNKMAFELLQEHQAKVFIDLMGRNINASVMTGLSYQSFKYDRALFLSLEEFIFQGLDVRSEIFRHELRHLGFRKKILAGALNNKIPISTGLIQAQKEGQGFRRVVLGLQESDYRSFMSFEELWTYTKSVRLEVEQLLRRMNQRKKIDDIYFVNARIEEVVRRLIVFFERTSRLGTTLSLNNFYAVTTFVDPSSQKASFSFIGRDNGRRPTDLLSEWSSLLYDHDIVHGIYEVKSIHPDEGAFWISLPLAVRGNNQSGNYVDLKSQMDQRIRRLSEVSRQSRDDLLQAYNNWMQASNEFLYKKHEKEETAALAKDYIESLNGLYKSLLKTHEKIR